MRFTPGEKVLVIVEQMEEKVSGLVISETDSLKYLVWINAQRIKDINISGNIIYVESKYLELMEK